MSTKHSATKVRILSQSSCTIFQINRTNTTHIAKAYKLCALEWFKRYLMVSNNIWPYDNRITPLQSPIPQPQPKQYFCTMVPNNIADQFRDSKVFFSFPIPKFHPKGVTPTLPLCKSQSLIILRESTSFPKHHFKCLLKIVKQKLIPTVKYRKSTQFSSSNI